MRDTEALVIGSGFGGAIAALRLGEAGVQTIVLERGRRWPVTEAHDTFATYDAPDGRAAWLSPVTVAPAQEGVPIDVYTGVLDRIKGAGIDVLAGAGVGGGSLVYNTVLYQPRRDLFARVFPSWLGYDEMDDVWYPKVRAAIGVSTMPADVLADEHYRGQRELLDEAAAAGMTARLFELGLDWDVIRAELAGDVPASLIAGQVWYGSNSGAKRSLDRTYLPRAEATGNVEVLPLHEVTDVRENGTGYVVAVNEIDDNGRVVARRDIHTRHLFLAAGSVATTRLLVRAREIGALPKLADAVGTRWGANGDLVIIRSGLPPTGPGEGGPAGAVLEDLDNPVAPIALACMPIPQAGMPEGFMGLIGMGLGPAKGSFAYDERTDTVNLTWPASDPGVTVIADGARATFERLGNGAIEAIDASLTGHPCGGVPIGLATDEYGRVNGYPGLYVVDGALIPGGSAACTNPALTIGALAERALATIVPDIVEG
ncbi:GMC family oxidoreductase N-terminal domain-containing protein [Sphaerisporangium perillae]|uniref:GMC family oxidoreductase N-terminal domain-containing protein n=1 Tax=Sphaerisporangium perillae TaxID=2935860 RepID=UPI00200DB9ED|nr:GMC oxidoreductase [Sphaerisporangium perillae]